MLLIKEKGLVWQKSSFCICLRDEFFVNDFFVSIEFEFRTSKKYIVSQTKGKESFMMMNLRKEMVLRKMERWSSQHKFAASSFRLFGQPRKIWSTKLWTVVCNRTLEVRDTCSRISFAFAGSHFGESKNDFLMSQVHLEHLKFILGLMANYYMQMAFVDLVWILWIAMNMFILGWE